MAINMTIEAMCLMIGIVIGLLQERIGKEKLKVKGPRDKGEKCAV